MARPGRLLFPVLAALAAVLAPVAAQEGAPDVDSAPSPAGGSTENEEWTGLESFGEEISVEVVNVEVWVSGKDGKPVTGLAADDFELFEDGEPVEVVHFAEYGGPDAPSPPAPAVAAPEPTPEAAEAPAAPAHVAILVDNWNLRPEDRSRVFGDLRTFLAERLSPGDRVAVAVHDRALALVESFTDDPEELLGALDRIERLAPSGVHLRIEWRSAIDAIEQSYREVSDAGAERVAANPCDLAWGSMESAARSYAATVQGHVQRSAGALASLADILAGLPGARIILYVGNGLAQAPGAGLFEFLGEICPNQRSEAGNYRREYEMDWLYEEVIARAHGAGVTLYTIESASPAVDLGLGGAGAGGASSREGGGPGQSFRPSTTVQRIREQDMETTLTYLADETGGRSVLDAADFSGDFERIAHDLRNYYSLGFTPADPGDGELHRIEVRLADGRDARIRHRAAYRDKPVEQRMVERIRAVAQFGGGENPLAVRLEVGEAAAAEEIYRVPLRIWVPLESLVLVPGDEADTFEGKVVLLMATTGARGELGPVRQKVVPVTGRGPEGEAVGEKLIEVEVDLPPGDHSVALAVRDGLGGTTSYLVEEFRVE